MSQQRTQRWIGATAASVAASAIAAATLTPMPGSPPVGGGVLCLACGDYGGVDLILNFILFLPLGVALRVAGMSLRIVALAAFAATVTVELLQLTVVAGRDASLGDVASNTAGGALGALLVAHWRTLARPGGRAAARLAWGWAGIWLVVAVATARSTTLASPGGVVLYRRAPPARRWAWFPGRVLAVAGGGAAITADSGDGDGRHAVPAHVPRGGPLRVAAAVVSGGPVVRAAAAIATMPDASGADVAALAQRGRDLVLTFRTDAASARVRVPGLAVSDLFAPRDERARRGGWPVAGDPIHIEGVYTRQALRLDVWWPGGHSRRTAALHPFVGWSYLLPWGYSYGRWAGVLSALWAGGLIAPAAYWAARVRAVRSGVPAAAAVLLAAVAGLAAVAPIAGAAAPPPAVWVAVGVGLLAGAWAGRAVVTRDE